MDNSMKIAQHEMVELHELIGAEVAGYKKMNAAMQNVQDAELKNFMQDALNAKKTKIDEMQRFINQISPRSEG